MKTVSLLFTAAFVSIQFFSCSENSEPSKDSALYFKTSLLEEQTKTVLRGSDSENDSLFTGTIEPPKETVIEFCTGKDLEWYNGTTGELKFKSHITKNTLVLNFFVYLDEQFLFGVSLIPNVMSYVVNEPVLLQDLYDESRYYISKGYPSRDEYLNKEDYWLSEEWWRIEREKNWKTLVESNGWKLFIDQLKKEGRYRK